MLFYRPGQDLNKPVFCAQNSALRRGVSHPRPRDALRASEDGEKAVQSHPHTRGATSGKRRSVNYGSQTDTEPRLAFELLRASVSISSYLASLQLSQDV